MSAKVTVASILVSLSPYHSINKVDPCPSRVHLSCEKRKKPCCASSFNILKQKRKVGSFCAPNWTPPATFPATNHNALSRAPNPLLTWQRLDRSGLYFFVPETCARDAILATFESEHDSCLHQQHQVKARPGSLLRNTLFTAGKQ